MIMTTDMSCNATTSEYSVYNFVSPCCNAFNYYIENNIMCSKCGNIIKTLSDDEKLTITIKFNEYSDKNNMSGDIIKIFDNNAKRFAHDRTCELIKKTCPKCGHQFARYLRNPQDKLLFVCEACRHVHNT